MSTTFSNAPGGARVGLTEPIDTLASISVEALLSAGGHSGGGGEEMERLPTQPVADGDNIGGPVGDAEQHFSDPPARGPLACVLPQLSPDNVGGRLASAVVQFVDGGLVTALATDAARIDGLWVVGFTRGSEKFAGSTFAANAVRRTGREWRSASLRVDMRSRKTKGVLSLWVSEDNRRYMVAYRDGPEVLRAIALWDVPIVVRQHLQRALNGNGTSAAETRRKAKALELDVEVEFTCKTCESDYKLTRREMQKSSNHKAKLHYFGLDMCVPCRDIANKIMAQAGASDDAIAAAADAGLVVQATTASAATNAATQPAAVVAPAVASMLTTVPDAAASAPEVAQPGSVTVVSAVRNRLQRAVAPIVLNAVPRHAPTPPVASTVPVPSVAGSDDDNVVPTEASEYARMAAEMRCRAGLDSGPFEDEPHGDSDGPRCWHMAGDLRAGDFILTREFCEPYSRNELLPYHRTGRKMERVVINDEEYPANDWLFDPVPIIEQKNGAIRATVLERSVHAGQAWVLFKIEASTHRSVPVRHRYTTYRYKRANFTWFRGSTVSEVCVDGLRDYVPSDVLGESMRYFANEANARTSASHIMGQLKLNEKLSARQIDYIIRLCCAVHDARAVPYARAVAGEKTTSERVAREMENFKHAWWVFPSLGDFVPTDDMLWWVRLFFWLGVLCAINAGFVAGHSAYSLATRIGLWDQLSGGFGFTRGPNAGAFLHHFDTRRVRVPGSNRWHTVYTANCTDGEVKGYNCSHLTLTESEYTMMRLWSGASRDCMAAAQNGEYKTRFAASAREGIFGSLNSSDAINSSCYGAAVVELLIAEHYDAYGQGLTTEDRSWLKWYEDVFKRWYDVSWAKFCAYWLHQLCGGTLQIVFLAPLWEEYVKHFKTKLLYWHGPSLGFLATVGICMFEWFVYIERNGWGNFMGYFPTYYMHLVCHALPLPQAIVYHFTFNLVVMRHFIVSELLSMFSMSFVLLWDIGLGVAAAAWLQWWHGITFHASAGSVGGGGFLGLSGIAAAVFAYNKGGSDRFPRVRPAGADSQFEALFDDPEFHEHFPMKEDSKVLRKRARGKNPKNELTQLMPEFAPITSFAANRANSLHSLAGRVLKKTPPVVRSEAGVVRALDNISKKMGYIEPDLPEEWASKFPPRKRDRYLLSFVRLAVFGMAAFGDTLLGARNPWYLRSCFLKHEVNLAQPDKIVKTARGTYRIASSDPRTIQASTDEVQAALGRYFTAYGRRASAVFDGSESSEVFGWRVVMAFGRSKSEVAQLMLGLARVRQNAVIDCGDDGYLVFDGEIVAIDAARWDAHVSATLLKLKARHLLRLGMPVSLVKILEKMILRKGGFQRRGIKFQVLGDVASGDPDTLYWNTVLGVAVLLDSLQGCTTFEQVAIRTEQLGIEYEVAARNTRTEAGPRLDFCSCNFVPSNDVEGFTLAPKLGRSLMKLSGTATNGNPAKLLAAKIGGLCYDLCAFPEIVRALRRLLPELPHAKPISESYFPVGKSEPSEPVRRDQYLRERYDVTLGEVTTEVEEWVDRARRGDMDAGDLVAMRKMVEVDYGKRPIAARGWCKGAVFLAIMCCCASGSDGGLALVSAGGRVGRNLFPEQTLSYQRQFQMPNKNQKKGGAAPLKFNQKPKAKKQRSVANVTAKAASGDGMYRLLAPLAKAAVAAAMPRALQAAGSRLMPSASRFSGSGDYVCNDIVHMGGGHPIKKGMAGVPITKFQHSEYIRDIVVPVTPTAFTSLKFNINAADAATFPWLSRLASLYTKYKFTKLLFEFRTTTSNYSAAGTLGTVVMAPHYNVDSQQFATKQAMEASTHAVSSAPSNSIIMGFECAKQDNNVSWYNMLNDATITRGNFTDAGYVEVSTSGLPGTPGTALGELWVHYACDLIEPYISQVEAPTTSSRGLTTCYSSAGNLVNPMELGIFGTQFSALIANASTDDYPAAAYAPGFKGTAPPSVENWFTWCSADAGKQLGFKYGGTYAIEIKQRISGQPGGATGAPYELSALSGALTVVSGNPNNLSPIVWSSVVNASVYGYRWVVTVGDGTVITTTKGSGWTGVALYTAVTDLTIVKLI